MTVAYDDQAVDLSPKTREEMFQRLVEGWPAFRDSLRRRSPQGWHLIRNNAGKPVLRRLPYLTSGQWHAKSNPNGASWLSSLPPRFVVGKISRLTKAVPNLRFPSCLAGELSPTCKRQLPLKKGVPFLTDYYGKCRRCRGSADFWPTSPTAIECKFDGDKPCFGCRGSILLKELVPAVKATDPSFSKELVSAVPLFWDPLAYWENIHRPWLQAVFYAATSFSRSDAAANLARVCVMVQSFLDYGDEHGWEFFPYQEVFLKKWKPAIAKAQELFPRHWDIALKRASRRADKSAASPDSEDLSLESSFISKLRSASPHALAAGVALRGRRAAGQEPTEKALERASRILLCGSLDEILALPGIGPKTLAMLIEHSSFKEHKEDLLALAS